MLEIAELKEENSSRSKTYCAIRRLDILDAFKESGNQPGWMVMDAIPVIPPDLRPMVQLEGGRFGNK